MEKFIEYYEEVIGLTDVKKAQAEVIEVHSHVWEERKIIVLDKNFFWELNLYLFSF